MTWGFRRRSSAERGRRPSRPMGCLLWLVAVIVALILLSLLFGGFQRGTKADGSMPPPVTPVTSVAR